MKSRWALIAVAVTSCHSPPDVPLRSAQDDGGTSAPQDCPTGWGFELEPRELHFGLVRVGDVVERPLAIFNRSTCTSTFTASVIPSTPAFTVATAAAETGIAIAPGMTETIHLRFAPTQVAPHESTLGLVLCIDGCLDEVPLAGDVVSAEVNRFYCQSSATISTLVGVCTTRTLSCLNASTANAAVLDVTTPALPFAQMTIGAVALPRSVPAGDPFDINVELCGGTVKPSSGSTAITISVDDGSGPRDVAIDVDFDVPY